MRSTGLSHFFKIGILSVAGMFLVTACKNVGPDFEKPEVPVADTWLEAENDKVDTSSTSYRDWWDVFEDPALHRQQRAGFYGFAEIGFGVLDNRRVILGSF